MAWDPEANELFPHTVTLTAPGAVNQYGRHVDGASPDTVAAHVEYTMRQVRNIQGELTASSITVNISGVEGIKGVTPEWKVTLPDGTSRPIVSVSRHADENGDLWEVVHLQ